MRRHRNNPSRKGKEESTVEQLSETEACKMSEKEFRVRAIQFINRMDEKIKNLCKNQEEIQNYIATMKNMMEGFNNSLEQAEDWISELEDKVQKHTQCEQLLEKKKLRKQEESLRELSDNITCI